LFLIRTVIFLGDHAVVLAKPHIVEVTKMSDRQNDATQASNRKKSPVPIKLAIQMSPEPSVSSNTALDMTVTDQELGLVFGCFADMIADILGAA
jgi:hypothetical protein